MASFFQPPSYTKGAAHLPPVTSSPATSVVYPFDQLKSSGSLRLHSQASVGCQAHKPTLNVWK
ncbi:hypothetical protein SESBI_13298 [Sesbania bispinosa]|nr:hypothetical protein SESBI_13298 [Sesbania bispinosa]